MHLYLKLQCHKGCLLQEGKYRLAQLRLPSLHVLQSLAKIRNIKMYHQNLVRISASAVQADIDEANAVFTGILGHFPSLTRTPYGNVNNTVKTYVGTPIVL